jgi:hypothetical protein
MDEQKIKQVAKLARCRALAMRLRSVLDEYLSSREGFSIVETSDGGYMISSPGFTCTVSMKDLDPGVRGGTGNPAGTRMEPNMMNASGTSPDEDPPPVKDPVKHPVAGEDPEHLFDADEGLPREGIHSPNDQSSSSEARAHILNQQSARRSNQSTDDHEGPGTADQINDRGFSAWCKQHFPAGNIYKLTDNQFLGYQKLRYAGWPSGHAMKYVMKTDPDRDWKTVDYVSLMQFIPVGGDLDPEWYRLNVEARINRAGQRKATVHVLYGPDGQKEPAVEDSEEFTHVPIPENTPPYVVKIIAGTKEGTVFEVMSDGSRRERVMNIFDHIQSSNWFDRVKDIINHAFNTVKNRLGHPDESRYIPPNLDREVEEMIRDKAFQDFSVKIKKLAADQANSDPARKLEYDSADRIPVDTSMDIMGDDHSQCPDPEAISAWEKEKQEKEEILAHLGDRETDEAFFSMG